MSVLKLVPTEQKARAARPRPITAYYFKGDQFRPIRVSRSTTLSHALSAIVKRVIDGEPIKVAEIVNQNGKLLKTVIVRYRKIEIK